MTVVFLLLVVLNAFWRHGQTSHTLLANFGFLAQIRYLLKSVGPAFRRYLFASDTEEQPFNRGRTETKLRHSFYPVDESQVEPFDVAVGAPRHLDTTHHIKRPIMISAMSDGPLGQNAVRALARRARLAGAVMNTGEGGTPKYHPMEGCDLIFQISTAKFGVRTPDGRLGEDKLAAIAREDQVKVIETELSQGAKPGKGGLLPKEKVTAKIAELRGVPMDEDVVSPAHHAECVDAESTVAFIGLIQQVAASRRTSNSALAVQKSFAS